MELLYESVGNGPIVSIDIQPAYEKWCRNIIPKFIELINTTTSPIYYWFNGSDVGIDHTVESIKYWLFEHGVDEDKLDRIYFREKGYAFFRNFMDLGMDHEDIVKIIIFMIKNDINDSRDISVGQWVSILGDDLYSQYSDIIGTDNIYVPDISIPELRQLVNCVVIGGGRDECLAEFLLLVRALGIPHKVDYNLVY